MIVNVPDVTLAEGALPKGRRNAAVNSRPASYTRALIALRIAAPAAVFLAWAIAAKTSPLIPSIGSTWVALVNGFTDGTITAGLLSSMHAILLGFVVSTVAGVLIGIALGRSRFWNAVLDPIISGLFAMPRFILYPVLLAIYGVGLTSKTWMAILSAIFPIIINTTSGMRDVSPALVKLGRSLQCNRLQMMVHIYMPGALPVIMVGVRLGFSLSFLGVIFAELFAASAGLGLLVQNAYSLQRYSDMFAVVVVIGIVASAGLFVLRMAERSAGARSE